LVDWAADGSGIAVVVGLGCEIVVLAGPESGTLEVQATANANSGTPIINAVRMRRRPRRGRWRTDLIVTEEDTIRSSIAAPPPRPEFKSSGQGQLAAALLLDDPPALDEEPLDDDPPADEPLLVLDGFDPLDESDDPVLAAAFLSPVAPAFSPPAFSPPDGLSPDPLDGAVLVAAALESVR
jgi:hypothetical protein